MHRSVFFAVCLVIGSAVAASAGEYFLYDLIPGRNILRYATLSETGNREMYADLSGRIGFELEDDNTINATTFDLTIQGPFYDDLLAVPEWAPFAPGDKLADFIAVDFANTRGLAVGAMGLNGIPQPATAYVGPDVAGDWLSMFSGLSYYKLISLEAQETTLEFRLEARSGLGGTFTLHVPAVTVPPGPGGVQLPMLIAQPNVVRIPEPATVILAIVGISFFGRRRPPVCGG